MEFLHPTKFILIIRKTSKNYHQLIYFKKELRIKMVKFTFIVCTEPYKYEAMNTLINLGETVIKKGHEILGIFFYGSGVYNIKGDILTDDSTLNLPDKLAEFCKKNGAKLAACSTWISFSGIKSTELIEGACQEGLGGLSDLIALSDRVIFFGPGG